MNPNAKDTDSDAGQSHDAQTPVGTAETASPSGPATAPAAARPSTKTPLFEAFHAARYQRQSLIREIQTANNRTLLSYVAGPGAPVERDDALAFVDLLHAVPAGADVDLILHTGGGDIDVTEKLANMLWAKIGAVGTLRVIVPDFAKSAGTLLALAADTIIMSDSSELGPIDPQLVRRSPSGN
jgi:ClpP class serine protease